MRGRVPSCFEVWPSHIRPTHGRGMEHALPLRLLSSFYPHASTEAQVSATSDQRTSSRSAGRSGVRLVRTPENTRGSPPLNSCHSVSPSSLHGAANVSPFRRKPQRLPRTPVHHARLAGCTRASLNRDVPAVLQRSTRVRAEKTGRPNTFGASARGQASLTSGDIRKTAHHFLRRPDIQ